MNITKAIGLEIGIGVSEFLNKTPEIQIYANENIHRYQWRDTRFPDTSDMWSNDDFITRLAMRNKLMEYLKFRGDY